jgi:rare lipoprotein A
MRGTAVVAVAACLVLSASCGKKHNRVARVPPAPSPSRLPSPRPAISPGYTEEGVASWYGIPFNGRPAADGEIYNMEALVAAHRLMPFNTWLRVTNLSNGKTVEVRVIDRGPFVEGRIIDLSKAAARQIDLIGPGTARVRLEVISAPADIPTNDFYAVQVAALSIYQNAERLRDEYARRFGTAQLTIKQGKTPLWRVLVGKEPSIDAARQLASVLAVEDKSVFVVRLDPSAVAPASDPVSEQP